MVNIIIPAYNAHNVIDIALKSIINQTIKDKIEVLVINDGSVKDYEDIIKKYKKYYKIREVTLKKNGGLYNAENTGIKEATGDYIMFLDADDYLAKNDAVERLYEVISGDDNLDFVCGMVLSEDERVYNTTYLHGKLYRLSFIRDNNIKVQKLYSYEDLAFNLHCLFISNESRYKVVDADVYYYEKDVSGSLTKKNNDEIKKLQSIITGYYSAKKFAKKKKKLTEYPKYSYVIFRDMFVIYFKRKNLIAKDEEYHQRFLKNCAKYYKKNEEYINLYFKRDKDLNVYEKSCINDFIKLIMR